MHEQRNNAKTVTIKLTRKNACDLLIATSAAMHLNCKDSDKWQILHNMLNEQIKAFDKKNLSK